MFDEEGQNNNDTYVDVLQNNDIYVEEEHHNYFQKMSNSFGGMCFGFILFLGAFPLLWWNEGRAVDYYQAINEGRKNVVAINSTLIDPANEGKLVWLTGLAEPIENVTDLDFGVEATMKVKLSRDVSMYQWNERVTTQTKDKVGGGTTTIKEYSYKREWLSYLVDSSRFKKSGYTNPTTMPYLYEEFVADVILGAFTLPSDMISSFYDDSSLTGDVLFDVNDIPSDNVLKSSKSVRVEGQGFYFGNDPMASQIGDTIVKYKAASGGTVSIIAQQSAQTFTRYEAVSGSKLYRIEMGVVSSDTMFDNAAAENKFLTMVLRVVGAVVMIIGISTILQPLAVAGDIIPCVGDCIGAAVGFVATISGLFLSLLVIGIAWVANRPAVLGIALGGTTLIVLLVFNGFRKKHKRKRMEMKMGKVDDLKMTVESAGY